ncbi:putative glucan endo-1,3-beta-glucosidase btgC [Smittium culicis]|uniref:glucan endo-1,3-beta-D-glucosidase n=1 Tax=Smittium culicis TaxID=133412 RepID=A0A1R1Y2H7_9FUNG|nr:putative glucan endo-1,3-beta-glucosidase btgC [Smittium culicis]
MQALVNIIYFAASFAILTSSAPLNESFINPYSDTHPTNQNIYITVTETVYSTVNLGNTANCATSSTAISQLHIPSETVGYKESYVVSTPVDMASDSIVNTPSEISTPVNFEESSTSTELMLSTPIVENVDAFKTAPENSILQNPSEGTDKQESSIVPSEISTNEDSSIINVRMVGRDYLDGDNDLTTYFSEKIKRTEDLRFADIDSNKISLKDSVESSNSPLKSFKRDYIRLKRTSKNSDNNSNKTKLNSREDLSNLQFKKAKRDYIRLKRGLNKSKGSKKEENSLDNKNHSIKNAQGSASRLIKKQNNGENAHVSTSTSQPTSALPSENVSTLSTGLIPPTSASEQAPSTAHVSSSINSVEETIEKSSATLSAGAQQLENQTTDTQAQNQQTATQQDIQPAPISQNPATQAANNLNSLEQAITESQIFDSTTAQNSDSYVDGVPQATQTSATQVDNDTMASSQAVNTQESSIPKETNLPSNVELNKSMNSGSSKFWGLTYSPYNTDGSCPSYSKVESDLITVSSVTNNIRLYSTDCDQLVNAAKAINQNSLPLNIYAGVWISNGDERMNNEIDTIIKVINTYGSNIIKGISIGNEEMFKGSMTESELVSKLQAAKSKFKSAGITGIPIYTTDTDSKFTKNMADASDVIQLNIYTIFDQSAKSAADSVESVFNRVEAAKSRLGSSKHVRIGETGFSSAGSSGSQSGSLQGEIDYAKALICKAAQVGSEYFYFEAKDALWKSGESQLEQSFGVFDSNFKPKFDFNLLSC